jgi:acyl carrier protein
MVPAFDASGFFAGDVYVLEGDHIIGLIAGMTLRPLPRILMGRFFDPPDPHPVDGPTRMQIQTQTQTPPTAPTQLTPTSDSLTHASPSVRSTTAPPTPPETTPANPISSRSPRDTGTTNRALALIASETRVDIQELSDETHLSQIGVDSLLSLVLVEKFAMELNIHLQPSFFLEWPTIGMIKAQLAG